MSRIHLYLPGNTRHGNVSARKRREYILGFQDWIRILKNTGFPVSLSFQRDDLDVFGVDESAFNGIELLSAPGNHFLPSRFEKHPRLASHAKFLLNEGRVVGNVPGYFTPEFDIPRTNILPEGEQILFALPGQTVLYSECSTSDVVPGSKLEGYKAIRFHDKIVVPMLGVKPMQDAFFFWQRFKTQENLEKLLNEIRAVVNDGKDNVLVFFLDLEAPLVGSHHGFAIWEELFSTICQSDLAQHFVSFNEATEVWRHQAVTIEGPTWTLFARQLGIKWTGLQPQLDYLDRVMLARIPRSLQEHKHLGQATTSDVLMVMDRKLRGPVTITADGEPIEIGHDQTIIDIALGAITTYENRQPLCEKLPGLMRGDDARWFAMRVADTVSR
ncbi:MAG: hypothetical protein WC654_00900 [Patescibacteria group bacterium]